MYEHANYNLNSTRYVPSLFKEEQAFIKEYNYKSIVFNTYSYDLKNNYILYIKISMFFIYINLVILFRLFSFLAPNDLYNIRL